MTSTVHKTLHVCVMGTQNQRGNKKETRNFIAMFIASLCRVLPQRQHVGEWDQGWDANANATRGAGWARIGAAGERRGAAAALFVRGRRHCAARRRRICAASPSAANAICLTTGANANCDAATGNNNQTHCCTDASLNNSENGGVSYVVPGIRICFL